MREVKDLRPIDPIARRWSPRAFSDRPVEPEKLRSIFEAARLAPSSANEQPWRFIVATRDEPESHQALYACLREGNQVWAGVAPVLMLTLARATYAKSGGENRHAWHDVGLAVALLSVQATALGLYLHQMAGILPERARRRFDVPEPFEVVSAIALGYLGDASRLPEDLQARERRSRSRKSLSEIVFTGRFGKPADL